MYGLVIATNGYRSLGWVIRRYKLVGFKGFYEILWIPKEGDGMYLIRVIQRLIYFNGRVINIFT